MHDSYERYHPEPYHREMSLFWWIKKKPYLLFITRELTSLFVALYAIILIIKLYAIQQGTEAWGALITTLSTPFSIILHSIILIFVLFHTYTWFKLAPMAMVIKIGKWKVPASAIIAGNFIAWIILSAVIIWFFSTL